MIKKKTLICQLTAGKGKLQRPANTCLQCILAFYTHLKNKFLCICYINPESRNTFESNQSSAYFLLFVFTI